MRFYKLQLLGIKKQMLNKLYSELKYVFRYFLIAIHRYDGQKYSQQFLEINIRFFPVMCSRVVATFYLFYITAIRTTDH